MDNVNVVPTLGFLQNIGIFVTDLYRPSMTKI